MPLVVETGAGFSNAESYGSVTEADAYHLGRGNELWATLSDTRKEQMLRRASDYITYIFGNVFMGVRAYTGQALAWPRIDRRNPNLLTLAVPLEVRQCCFELALIAHQTPLMPGATTVTKKSIKVGPISVEYDANGYTGPKFVVATSRLAPYLSTYASGMTAKLVRT